MKGPRILPRSGGAAGESKTLLFKRLGDTYLQKHLGQSVFLGFQFRLWQLLGRVMSRLFVLPRRDGHQKVPMPLQVYRAFSNWVLRAIPRNDNLACSTAVWALPIRLPPTWQVLRLWGDPKAPWKVIKFQARLQGSKRHQFLIENCGK